MAPTVAGREQEPVGRLWGGRTAQARRAERRSRLLDAGLEAFATEGFASSSINRICQGARVSERYFYEEFASKAALLQAVYDRIIEEVLLEMRRALEHAPPTVEDRTRASLTAFTRTLTDDPRKARINFIEVVGADPEVEAHRRRVVRGFGALTVEQWRELIAAGDLPDRPLGSLPVALGGAVQEALVDFVSEPGDRKVDDVVDDLVRLYVAVARHG